MKVNCPKCKKVVQAPDEWAGKKVKCPKCKHLIKLPAPDDGSTEDDLAFNLSSLASLEKGSQPLITERKAKPLTLKEAQEASRPEAPAHAPPADPLLRICPKCGEKIKAPDIYGEVMCRYCGTGIPGQDPDKGENRYKTDLGQYKGQDTFYSGFTKAAGYPVGAVTHIGIAMAAALGSIAVPVFALVGLMATTTLNPAGGKKAGEGTGWVGGFISAMFAVQAIYMGAVAYGVLVDTVRTTNSGSEAPPGLTWNVLKLGAALGGYIALVVLYLLAVCLIVMISNGAFPTQMSDFAALGNPGSLIALAAVSFVVPMCMIGLASGQPMNGLNPVQVGKSIGRTIGNYTFLFLISLVYLGVFSGLMAAVTSWAMPSIAKAAKEGMKAGYLNLLGGLGAWALLVGAGFYFAYAVGRILGLFSRTYRDNLAFVEE